MKAVKVIDRTRIDLEQHPDSRRIGHLHDGDRSGAGMSRLSQDLENSLLIGDHDAVGKDRAGLRLHLLPDFIAEMFRKAVYLERRDFDGRAEFDIQNYLDLTFILSRRHGGCYDAVRVTAQREKETDPADVPPEAALVEGRLIVLELESLFKLTDVGLVDAGE